MVEQFVNDFYHAKPEDLSDIVTSSFTFRSPLSQKLDFGQDLDFIQYRNYSKRYFNNLKAKQQVISSEDDVIFKVKFILEMLSFNSDFLKEISGIVTLTIKDDLVDCVEVTYNDALPNSSDLEKIKSA
uniref:SnoaL-like domain-containing protein n=1 Tax=OCS116 cluster bacterium TaxID=2030921 RepID=A0A2A4YUM4_9PROT